MYKILKNIIEMDDYSVQKLSKSQPPTPFQWNTVEGTELNVDDCIGGKGKIAAKGNTYQKQLSGKNLFGISDYEKTYNGVQIKIKDGEITLNGTCTGTGTVYIGPKDEQILNGTYTISRNSISGTMSGSGNINLRNVSDDSIISGTQMSLTINSRTFTLENANVEYGIYLMKDATFDNYKFRPQLVEGDTPDYDFEPYCGGQAAPNPSYEIPIKVVTGDNVVKHVGKNFWGLKDQTITKAGVTFIIKDGVITANGTYTANTLTQFENEDNLVLNGNYTVKTFPVSGSASTAPNFNVKNSDGTTLANSVATSGSSVTFLVEKSSLICGIYAQRGTTFDNLKLKFQIEKGTTPTQYEPYRGEEYKLDLWKENEFDKNNVNKINAYFNKTGNISSADVSRTFYVPCKASTLYKISKVKSARFRAMYTTEIPQNGVAVNGGITSDESTEIIIKTGNNAKYLCVFYYHTTADTLTEQEILESIQIQEAIELCKIGDYSDILFKNVVGDENYNAELESGAWYKKKVIDKVVFDENGAYTYQNNNRFIYNSGNWNNKENRLPKAVGTSQLGGLYCNKFKEITANESWNTQKEGVAYANGTFSIACNSIATDVDAFKTYLADNNIILYYLLKTINFEKITDTTLISQLEALRKAKWFKDVNHWWTETNNLEPMLKGTYRQAINE